MKTVVVDASMAANWILDDEKNEAANQILAEIKLQNLITPALFWYEMRSICLASVKRGRTTEDEALRLLDRLRVLDISEYPLQDDALIFSLAIQHDLSAYDAAYLTLAFMQSATLATNDRKLARAALDTGLELLTAMDVNLFN